MIEKLEEPITIEKFESICKNHYTD